ncbi:hypothetical protein [Psychrobacter sp. UBA3480]|uniref:hypothetical protein n=1 Tax=Psychrobacter sp. UBA3480 TaxID=1947350 RepID=UPI0025DA6D0E|nr:hypothetical protein [Psychrobacter sp. UBA3480]
MKTLRHRTAMAILAKLGTQSLVPIKASDLQIKPVPTYNLGQKSIIFFDPTDAELDAIYSGKLSGSSTLGGNK